MNKVAVHHNSSYRDSPPSTLPHYQPVGMEPKQFSKQPSRLQMLQADYQQRLLREKEEKMIRMYEDQQRRALGKVNHRQTNGNSPNGISAREFFQERRKLEQKGYQSPPIEEHYRQLRRGNSSGGYSSASSHASSRYGKNSAGKDRSNLLQPIDMKTPPVPTKPRMARQKPANGVQARNNVNRAQNGNYNVRQDNSRTSSNDSSPPPNLQTLRNFQRKRLGAPLPPRDENEGPQKLTDFQRWQLEQNKAREQRLEKHRQSVEGRSSQGVQQWGDGESSDGDKENMKEELELKQREIQEEIERHKLELENMRKQKEAEEQEARRAAEAERRREAEREKKRRQQAAEEKKRRMEEEEREKKEEERYRREEEKKRQMRMNEERKRQQQLQQQQRSRAARPKPRTPSPAGEDDYYQQPDRNLDLYIQAAMDDESQGSGSVRLAPCKVCGRKFAAERLAKHQAACKNANKKRKVFDPTKMRTEGTEMAKYVGKSNKTSRQEKKKKDWRAQHENFIETIRYAKRVSEMEAAGIKPANLPPPPKTVNPDYVNCPKCNRNFNPDTAERHIPNCKARPRR